VRDHHLGAQLLHERRGVELDRDESLRLVELVDGVDRHLLVHRIVGQPQYLSVTFLRTEGGVCASSQAGAATPVAAIPAAPIGAQRLPSRCAMLGTAGFLAVGHCLAPPLNSS
jgi:hypothetical protein